jgi:hypothetical protein
MVVSDASYVEIYVQPPGERSIQRSNAVAEIQNPEWPDAIFEL